MRKEGDSASSAPKSSVHGAILIITTTISTSTAAGAPPTIFPPSGGVGLRFLASYGWWPEEGAADELMFPKGAEIREAEDINGDWFWGCYAGAKGLFPGNYGRVVGRVE